MQRDWKKQGKVAKKLTGHKRIPSGQVKGELLQMLKNGGMHSVAESNYKLTTRCIEILATQMGVKVAEIRKKLVWTGGKKQATNVRTSNAFPGVPGKYVVHTLEFDEAHAGALCELPPGWVWGSKPDSGPGATSKDLMHTPVRVRRRIMKKKLKG